MKKRILVPIVGQGSIIHIIRTGMLEAMNDFCKPVVALLWQQDDLIEELKSKGYEVVLIPGYNVSDHYAALRSKLNYWYYNARVKTPSTSIQKSYLQQFKKKQFNSYKKLIKEQLLKLQIKVQPNFHDELLKKEDLLIRQQGCYSKYAEWLESLNIDGLFTVTPFLNEVDLMARILRKKKTPILASIHSFDNVTKRGWPSTFFDHYIVWNNYNKSELERISPRLKENCSITVAGAPQFDFHFNEKYCWTKDEWRKKLGLPSNKKIILYSGGPVALLPDEPQYLLHLKEAFDQQKFGDDTVILFRCHPLDKKERWIKYVGESKHIIYDTAPNGEKKLDQVNVFEDDIRKLMSTLKYSDIHINVVSTMSVDGSAFNKPQIGPFYDDIPGNNEELFRKMYYQEHYLPIINSGVVNLAYTKEEYLKIVKQALLTPEKYSGNNEKCLREIITFTDGRSTTRAVATIKAFFDR